MIVRTAVLLVTVMLPGAPPPEGSKAGDAPSGPAFFEPHRTGLLTRYCVECDEAAALKDRKIRELILENVESGEMPPEDEPELTEDELARFVGWIKEKALVVDCTEKRDPGRVTSGVSIVVVTGRQPLSLAARPHELPGGFPRRFHELRGEPVIRTD